MDESIDRREDPTTSGTPAGPVHATPDCDRAIDLFGAYLADDLSRDERESFLAHVKSCGPCHDKLLALELYLHVASVTAS